MTDTKTIHSELNRIQKELKAPKNQRNSFGGFDYRSAEDILEGYKKVAGETAVILTDEMVLAGDRHYIKSNAVLMLGESTVSTSAYAREPLSKKGMDESQITGATSSYARKYALNALFAIDDAKDTDFTDADRKEIEAIEKHEAEIDMIDDLESLKAYWEANKGAGKEFANLVTKRKLKINQDAKA